MRMGPMIILQAFVVAQARAQNTGGVSSDKIDAIAVHLDGTALGRRGQLTLPQRIPALPARPSRSSRWLTAHALSTDPESGGLKGRKATIKPRHSSSFSFPPKQATPRTFAAYRDWRDGNAQRSLVDRGLQPVTGQRALMLMQNQGAILVDVRPEQASKVGMMLPDGRRMIIGRPKGAVNVPFFRPVTGNSLRDVLKRLSTRVALRKTATERDPDFVQKVTALAPDRFQANSTVILACDRGGSVKDDDASNPSSYTQSLQAAYELYEAGCTKIRILEGGIRRWQQDGLPMEDNDDDDNPDGRIYARFW